MQGKDEKEKEKGAKERAGACLFFFLKKEVLLFLYISETSLT